MILNFSELANNSVNGFNIEFDTLVFDDPAISAAQVGLLEGANVGLNFGGKTVFLIATVQNLTTANITFADGSMLIVGDNTIGTGNDPKANSLLGGDKNDQLIGLGGNDTLVGDDGNDLLSGRGGKDLLIGDAGKDDLQGGLGEDILRGGGNADALEGGDGSDRFEFFSPSDSRATATGYDTISDFTGNGVAQGADRIYYLEAGTVQNYDESGNNHDPGFAGCKQTAEEIFLNSDGGKKYAFIQDAGPGPSFLFADLNGDFIAEFCVALKNVFLDDFSFDYIKTTIGTNGPDNLDGGHSNDSMSGGGGGDTISGGDGDDTLNGGNGNDVLIGGRGADELTGGKGNDRITYQSAADSKGTGTDVIIDFVQGQDRINLRPIDAIAGGPDNDAFSFIGTDNFNNQAGELRYRTTAGQTIILADLNGDGTTDLRIILDGVMALTAGDFIL